MEKYIVDNEGKYDDALKHLSDNESKVVDKLTIHVKTAEFLLLSGKHTESLAKWMFLLQDQTENYRFHTGMQTALLQLSVEDSKNMLALGRLDLPSSVMKLTDAQKHLLLNTYKTEKCFQQRTCATTIRKICFSLLTGDALKNSLKEHIMTCCRKGVPALFNDICHLVTSPYATNKTQYVTEPMDFKAHQLVIEVRSWLDEFVNNRFQLCNL